MRLASLRLLCCVGGPVLSLSSDVLPADTDGYYSTSCRQGSAAGCSDYEEADETPLIQRTRRQTAGKTALFPPALSILDEGLVQDPGAEELLAKERAANDVFRSKYHNKFAYVGCYPLLGNDSVEGDEANVTLRDMFCANRPKKHPGGPIVPCRSGLPFYRFLFDTQGADDCSRFCSSKGFDISGTLARDNTSRNKYECRCGASRSNVAAWQRTWPDTRLLFSLNGSVHPNDPLCKIIVYKYSGGFEDMGMPQDLISLNEDDTKYIKDVLEANPHVPFDPDDLEAIFEPNAPEYLQGEIGHLLSSGDMKKAREAGLGDSSGGLLETKAGLGVRKNGTGGSLLETKEQRSKLICADKPDTGLTIGGQPAPCSVISFACSRDDSIGDAIKNACIFTCGLCTNKDKWTDCYPHNCGAAPVWKTQNKDGNFIIRYVFDWDLDDIRKEAFRSATKTWESETCIRFKEGGEKPRVRVRMVDTTSCSATVGYPGKDGEAEINLGFCRSMQQVGNIIHEIGHTLGMQHTQKRPDASGRIWLPDAQRYEGPYLKMFWENIPVAWQPQYFPDRNAYTGSGNQQAGDPYAGYAAYDYESIMHYSTGFNRFTAVNPAFDSVVGQRRQPSPGDFREIKDMYQCGAEVDPDLVVEEKQQQGDWWNPFSFFDETSILYQWVAGAYGDCKKRENPTASETKCFRTREVSCEDWNAESVDAKHCVAMDKPEEEEECECELGCADRYPTLLKMGGQDVSCYQLKSQCNDAKLATHVQQVCPRTCGKCTDEDGPGEPDCRDMSPYALILDVHGKFMSCEALAKQDRCKDFADSAKVRERCPESCGLCPKKDTEDAALTGPATPCVDDKDFRTSAHQSCHVFTGYNCSTVDDSEAVMKACPKSCDLCKFLH